MKNVGRTPFTKQQKIGLIIGIISALVLGTLSIVLPRPDPEETKRLLDAAKDSERYTEQYIRSKAGEYQKEFGALKSIKSVKCIRQYNAYPFSVEGLHKLNGRTMSTCYAYVEFERDNASIRLIMSRPIDNSVSWYVQSSEVQHGLTNCAASPKWDSSC